MSRSNNQLNSFGFEPGTRLVGKYQVLEILGSGYEGEVYRVKERSTGIVRAAKFFYPHRNVNDRAVKYYARMLHKLRDCPIIIQYVTHERMVVRDFPVSFLVSEFAEGEVLHDFVAKQPRKYLSSFEALHLLHTLAKGMAMIHNKRESHGDLHTGNVLVRRRGLGFDVKLVDFYQLQGLKPERIQDDVLGLVQILHECVGGQKHYKRQPPEIKGIVRGLKWSLIRKRFRTAVHLLEYLEELSWE